MRLDDPEVVREEYADEARLAVRKAAYTRGGGTDPHAALFSAIAEARPKRVLEVGPGEGEFAERIQTELGCDVIAIDQSQRMVDLTRARGVDAKPGDVCDLPFEDGTFDCAVAAWMLFHVAEIERALGELARVLSPSGRLVAVTNSRQHWRELKDLLGTEGFPTSFDAEDAERLLSHHFARVVAHDASGWLAFSNRDEAQRFVDSTMIFAGREVPDFEGPFKVRRTPVIFVADKS